jgi:hypothetical protein
MKMFNVHTYVNEDKVHARLKGQLYHNCVLKINRFYSEIYDLLGCYVAYMGNCLPMFGTTSRSHIPSSSIIRLTIKDGCAETSVRIKQPKKNYV